MKIKFMRGKRVFVFSISTLFLSACIIVYISDKLIKNAAKGKLYNEAASIPFNKTGLLLGTGKYISNGFANPFIITE